MKKTIKILVKKLEQDQDGNLTGGFSAIKGGFKNFTMLSDNDGCTNSDICGDTTNTGKCVNSGKCG